MYVAHASTWLQFWPFKKLTFSIKKFKITENKVTELNSQVLQIKSELEESQKKVSRNQQQEKTLKDELESLKIQYLDMQRAERTVRMDLEKSRQTVWVRAQVRADQRLNLKPNLCGWSTNDFEIS